jgi:hypothetical protein
MATLDTVDLHRYEVTGLLGVGADYEARAALERATGKKVVLKRPVPQMIQHQLHPAIEARTDRILQVYQEVGYTIPSVISMVGYTDRANHDAYFGDALGQPYRVIVEERAVGIPLMAELKARFTGVPIGVGQNLFALFPLGQPDGLAPFAIHQQLLDLEEAFFQAGYIVLDLRPHNVFYQPASGRLTVIDCGAVQGVAERSRNRQPDIHDFYLEMLQFYTTPQAPPLEASKYRDPHGLQPIVNAERTLDQLARQFTAVADQGVRQAALTLISQVRQRGYATFADFRHDLMAYLEVVHSAHQALPPLAEARQAWAEALQWLRAAYWQRYLFDPEAELAAFTG